MFYSGISDEAGKTIDKQIQAHNELGWDYMELRLIDGVNITQVSEDIFEKITEKLAFNKKKVSCFASAIANWSRPITCDPTIDIEDLKRAIPRMHKLNTKFIRVMSYPNDPNHPLPENEWRKESIRRMKELAKIAEDGGVILVHENCSGWGGLSAENSNILLGEVNSPALKVVFDTGNPVTYGQDAWEYYLKVKKDIVYVHIKDAKKINGQDVYCLCGDGDGYVKEIVYDLLKSGYDGGFSIEPHLAAVIHTGQQAESEEHLYNSYISYGRKLMEIVNDVLKRI
ncbi:MAG: sugar phosphate isomerase/epimerase [Candidatus Hydrogenedentes bacterium]|nr:sugar phosphate isomerase/epimerase [Candidatus Hydrogenedentota bacterium]